MKRCFIHICIIWLLPALVYAAEPLADGAAPAFTLEEALAQARQCAQKQSIAIEGAYLQSVVFSPYRIAPGDTMPTQEVREHGRYWTVTWQIPMAKGGTTYIYVHEDGFCHVSWGE